MISILRCPRCKEFTEIDYDRWCQSRLAGGTKFRCKNPLCDKNELVYHKLKGE